MTKLIFFARGNAISLLALFLAAGGGYALAATSGGNTISACANKHTGELFLHTHGRCKKGEKTVTWSKQGPVGPAGSPGAAGPAGQPPPSAWAIVSNSGQAVTSDGITATRVSAGTYQITVTAPACANKQNAPVVSVSDANPPNGQTAGAFPTAWVGNSGIGPFTVVTGVVVNGTFTPTDHTFNIQDVCGL